MAYANKNKNLGLTPVEIIIAIALTALILLIMLPRIISPTEQIRISKARNDIRILQEALDNYKLDNGFYPTTSQGLRALVRPPRDKPIPQNWRRQNWQRGGYLRQLPFDPWGRPYNYLNPGIQNPQGVDIFTYGPTGKPGGTGENATIGNW